MIASFLGFVNHFVDRYELLLTIRMNQRRITQVLLLGDSCNLEGWELR